MIFKILVSIFGYLFILDGILLLTAMFCLIIRDIIDDLKRWYKGDDWGWTEILEEYGYQDIYG